MVEWKLLEVESQIILWVKLSRTHRVSDYHTVEMRLFFLFIVANLLLSCARCQDLSSIKAILINRLYEVANFCTSAERIKLILNEVLDPFESRFSTIDTSQRDSVVQSDTFKAVASVAVKEKSTLAASITGPFATQSTSEVRIAPPSATPFPTTSAVQKSTQSS